MPDHLHALISFPDDQAIRDVISNWKRYLATTLKIDWQRDFFDHRLRGDESFADKAEYVRANPVRARLVTASENWPYFWTPDEAPGAPGGRALPRSHSAPGAPGGRALPRSHSAPGAPGGRALPRSHSAPGAPGGRALPRSRSAPGAPGGRALPMLVAIAVLACTACRPDMSNQPKARPLTESDFFSNASNARALPPHTVARGDARENVAFYTGLTNGVYITRLPVKLTSELLARGRERFDAMCAECHDRTGSGNGMVVQRGFPQPPSYHVDRLRNAPIGHFYDVITNGYGVMYSYATRVEPADRWAIAAYIRALQLSHHATLSDVEPAEQSKLEGEQ